MPVLKKTKNSKSNSATEAASKASSKKNNKVLEEDSDDELVLSSEGEAAVDRGAKDVEENYSSDDSDDSMAKDPVKSERFYKSEYRRIVDAYFPGNRLSRKAGEALAGCEYSNFLANYQVTSAKLSALDPSVLDPTKLTQALTEHIICNQFVRAAGETTAPWESSEILKPLYEGGHLRRFTAAATVPPPQAAAAAATDPSPQTAADPPQAADVSTSNEVEEVHGDLHVKTIINELLKEMAPRIEAAVRSRYKEVVKRDPEVSDDTVTSYPVYVYPDTNEMRLLIRSCCLRTIAAEAGPASIRAENGSGEGVNKRKIGDPLQVGTDSAVSFAPDMYGPSTEKRLNNGHNQGGFRSGSSPDFMSARNYPGGRQEYNNQFNNNSYGYQNSYNNNNNNPFNSYNNGYGGGGYGGSYNNNNGYGGGGFGSSNNNNNGGFGGGGGASFGGNGFFQGGTMNEDKITWSDILVSPDVRFDEVLARYPDAGRFTRDIKMNCGKEFGQRFSGTTDRHPKYNTPLYREKNRSDMISVAQNVKKEFIKFMAASNPNAQEHVDTLSSAGQQTSYGIY